MRAVCCGGEEDAAAPEDRAEAGAAKSVRGHREGRPTGTGERVRFLWCTAAGGWLAFAVQLLLRCCRASRPRSPDACAACVDATRGGSARTQGAAGGEGALWTHLPPRARRGLTRASAVHLLGPREERGGGVQ